MSRCGHRQVGSCSTDYEKRVSLSRRTISPSWRRATVARAMSDERGSSSGLRRGSSPSWPPSLDTKASRYSPATERTPSTGSMASVVVLSSRATGSASLAPSSSHVEERSPASYAPSATCESAPWARVREIHPTTTSLPSSMWRRMMWFWLGRLARGRYRQRVGGRWRSPSAATRMGSRSFGCTAHRARALPAKALRARMRMSERAQSHTTDRATVGLIASAAGGWWTASPTFPLSQTASVLSSSP